jgi:hypothetical protein
MTRHRALPVLAAVLLATACTDPTQPPERTTERTPERPTGVSTQAAQRATERYRFAGRGVEGFWYSGTECAESYTWVSGALNRLPEKQSHIEVSVESYDYCTGTYSAASGGTSPANLAVSKDLSTATAKATVTLYDWWTERTFDVAIDLAWNATSPMVRTRERYSFTTPGFRYTGKFDGKERYASVSGSISDGMTNFAPDAGDGRLFDVKSGERYMQKQ